MQGLLRTLYFSNFSLSIITYQKIKKSGHARFLQKSVVNFLSTIFLLKKFLNTNFVVKKFLLYSSLDIIIIYKILSWCYQYCYGNSRLKFFTISLEMFFFYLSTCIVFFLIKTYIINVYINIYFDKISISIYSKIMVLEED